MSMGMSFEEVAIEMIEQSKTKDDMEECARWILAQMMDVLILDKKLEDACRKKWGKKYNKICAQVAEDANREWAERVLGKEFCDKYESVIWQ